MPSENCFNKGSFVASSIITNQKQPKCDYKNNICGRNVSGYQRNQCNFQPPKAGPHLDTGPNFIFLKDSTKNNHNGNTENVWERKNREDCDIYECGIKVSSDPGLGHDKTRTSIEVEPWFEDYDR